MQPRPGALRAAALVLAAQRRGSVLMHDAGQRISLRRGDTVISLVPARNRDEREARAQRSARRRTSTYTERLEEAREPAGEAEQ